MTAPTRITPAELEYIARQPPGKASDELLLRAAQTIRELRRGEVGKQDHERDAFWTTSAYVAGGMLLDGATRQALAEKTADAAQALLNACGEYSAN